MTDQPTDDALVEELARVLDVLRLHTFSRHGVCECGKRGLLGPESQRQHIATALLPLFREAQAEALEGAITDEGRTHWAWAEKRRARFGGADCVCVVCGLMASITTRAATYRAGGE